MIMRLRKTKLLLSLGWLLLFLSLTPLRFVSAEIQATWTPNEQDQDAGPLPLSMKQRQELLKLEQAIRNAPDPEATLRQVADANQMEPAQLANMLQRNRHDLESGAVPSSGNHIWAKVAGLGATAVKWAKQHPRTAVTVGTVGLASAYSAFTIPRTGLVLSTTKSVLSKGATTLFNPPVAYLEQAVWRNVQRPLSTISNEQGTALYDEIEPVVSSLDDDDDNDNDTQGQAIWLDKQQLKKQSTTVQQAVTAASVLSVHDLRGLKFESIEADVVVEAAWEQAVEAVIHQRTLTEFDKGNVRFFVDNSDDNDDNDDGILIVRGLGDWGGFGLVPLRRVSLTEFDSAQDSTVALTLHTVQGAHWDGQIHVQLDLQGAATTTESDEEDAPDEDCLVVRVTLLVPKKGKAPPRRVAQGIVQAVHDSVVTSIRTRTRQALARQSQSVRFQTAAKTKAATRRTSRAVKERELEEMAADRRRRWQRANPSAGSYRPSGDRMRSPNNAVYH